MDGPEDTEAGRTLGVLSGGVAFAQAAAALPDGPEGRAWRAATPALVGLHVLAGRLSGPDEEPLGRARGLALLGQHRAALRAAFGEEVPAEAAELLAEVQRLLGAAA